MANNESGNNTEENIQNERKPARKRGSFFRGIFAVITALGNLVFLAIIIGLVVILFAGRKDIFMEQVLEEGPKSDKIVVISLSGIVDNRNYQLVRKQIQRAQNDESVRGLIFRVNSPGGTISASDGIFHEIQKYRDKTKEPVISFMQGKATSGAYYASAACDSIVAEPTVITGSIGVIFSHFVVSDLLEGKLGIKPVVIKRGERKNWPSLFHQPSEKELDYIETTLLDPAYARFVEIVDRGRASLSTEEVKKLADGSIYPAKEALDRKLIDTIGYLGEAVKQVKSLTGIKQARVVEYHKPFSLSDLLRVKTEAIPKLDKASLYKLSLPEALYLWAGY